MREKGSVQQLFGCSLENPAQSPRAAVVSPQEVPRTKPRIETGLLGAV